MHTLLQTLTIQRQRSRCSQGSRSRANRSFVTIATLSFAFVSQPLESQSVALACPGGSFKANGDPDNTKIAQDACVKALDLFQYIVPQLGALVAGGNLTQGLTSTVGGLGHFSVGVRGNGIIASFPDIDRVVPATRGAQSSNYTISKPMVGLPVGDLTIGITKGLPLILTNVGGIDLLLSAAYLPSYSNSSVDITVPSGSWNIGYGAKLGIIQESAIIPGLSVSFLTRRLPVVSITGKSGDDRLMLDDLRVRTNSWRVVGGKSFLFLGGAAGFGRDSYDTDATISATVAPRPASEGGSAGPIPLQQKLSRYNTFGSLWINMIAVRIVGEIGRVSGGDVQTFNQFSGTKATDARTYGSVGVSVGF